MAQRLMGSGLQLDARRPAGTRSIGRAAPRQTKPRGPRGALIARDRITRMRDQQTPADLNQEPTWDDKLMSTAWAVPDVEAHMRLAVAMLGLMAMLATASAQERTVAKILIPACSMLSDLKTVMYIVEHEDQPVFDRFYDEKFHNQNDCIFLNRGQTVVIDSADREGFISVRVQGTTKSYWTSREAFEPEQAK